MRFGGFSWRYLIQPVSHVPHATPAQESFFELDQEEQGASQCADHGPTVQVQGSGLEHHLHERLRLSRPIH
jgi:hypothetical protein